jgi:hypothetical protein
MHLHQSVAAGQATVHVRVFRIVNFKDTAGFMDKTDPYVQLQYGTTLHKTTAKNNAGGNAVFNEVFSFVRNPSENQLKVAVFDSDTLLDDLLGLTTIDLRSGRDVPADIPRGSRWDILRPRDSVEELRNMQEGQSYDVLDKKTGKVQGQVVLAFAVSVPPPPPPLFLRVIVTRGPVPDVKLNPHDSEGSVVSFTSPNARGVGPSTDIVPYLSVPCEQPSGLLLPLHRAVMLSTGRGKYGVLQVSALVASGASLDRPDADGCTAIFYAAGNEHVLKLLLSKGADVNVSSNNGNTALHYAAAGNSANSCSMLIHHGANLIAVNANALTPRMLAETLSKTAAADFLALYEQELSRNIQVSDRGSCAEIVCQSPTRRTTIVRGDNGGLGLTLQQFARESVDTEPYTITALIPAGAAEKSGQLAIGERIVAVDGTPVASLEVEDIQALIRGSPNTPVTLTIIPPPRAAGGPGASRGQLAAEVRGPIVSIEQDVGASKPANLAPEPMKRKLAFNAQGPEARMGPVRWNGPVPPGTMPANDMDGVSEHVKTPGNSVAGNDVLTPMGDLPLPSASVPIVSQGEVEYWAESSQSAPKIPYSSGRGGGGGGGGRGGGLGDIPAVKNAEKNPVTLTMEEARATFEEIDKNHDEELSQIEYIKALRRNPELAKRLGDVFSIECVLYSMCLGFSSTKPCGGTQSQPNT